MKISRFLSIFLFITMVLAGAGDTCAALRREGSAEKLGYKEGDSVVVIPARVRAIPPYCFAGCEGLRRVEFAPGASCLKIGEFAFSECRDLLEFDMPEGVVNIGDGAFRGCVSLRSIRLPRHLQIISREAFMGCRGLADVAFPDVLHDIKPLAFLDCRSLSIDSIPQTVRRIGNNAFGRCEGIVTMTLPADCTEVGSYAFADCISLERITLPGDCRMLGELLFSGCLKLREIRELSPVPPMIECNSFLFEPDDAEAFDRCGIVVPAGRKDSYERSPFWNHFRISEYNATR